MYQMNLAFQNPVAVGEHPKIVDDCVELIKQISEAEEALESLEALEVQCTCLPKHSTTEDNRCYQPYTRGPCP